jgi:hypothetical protein
MAEEGKGVALAILGVVAVIAVVGLVLLFTGATGKVSAPYEKTYGGVNRYEDFPYLVDRTTGGFLSTPNTAEYLPEGYHYSETEGTIQEQEEAPGYGFPNARYTYQRQKRNIPSGQLCASGPDEPGFRCPIVNGMQTVCVDDLQYAESSGWVAAPEHPCYLRASQV